MAQNKVTIDHDMTSLLDIFKREIFFNLNCHAIGVIDSFDETTQTVQAKISYKRKIDNTLIDYPAIIDCPVIVLGGGTGSLRFPISSGDTCLFMFNDRDIDNWFSGGGINEPNTSRLHSFSDAIALIGPRSLQAAFSDYSATKTELVNGSVRLSLGTKVHLVNAVTDLKTALGLLTTALDTFFTATSSAAIEPTLAPAAAAAKIAVAAYKTTIEGLLE